MYCNVHHNFWPRLNFQLVYESHIPLDKIDVMLQSIKDELTEPFVFIYITLYFPWFYLWSGEKKKNPSAPTWSTIPLHHSVTDSGCFYESAYTVRCCTNRQEPPAVVAAVPCRHTWEACKLLNGQQLTHGRPGLTEQQPGLPAQLCPH